VDNTVRRIRYLVANTGASVETARELVRLAYRDGTTDAELGLTPAQCSRIRHNPHTAPGRTHFNRQRITRKARKWRRIALLGG
jgi:hypothetical protein